MILVDVNVLVYAHRPDTPDHDRMFSWLDDAMNGAAPFGCSEMVLSGFLRVVTHPKVFAEPTPLAAALAFADAFRIHPNVVPISPGPRHWEIFADLCRISGARGNAVPDAYLAAMAIESGCEWITTDRGFGRFPKLSWRHPLD